MFTFCMCPSAQVPMENLGCFCHFPMPALLACPPPFQLLDDTQAAKKGPDCTICTTLSLACVPHGEVTLVSEGSALPTLVVSSAICV